MIARFLRYGLAASLPFAFLGSNAAAAGDALSFGVAEGVAEQVTVAELFGQVPSPGRFGRASHRPKGRAGAFPELEERGGKSRQETLRARLRATGQSHRPGPAGSRLSAGGYGRGEVRRGLHRTQRFALAAPRGGGGTPHRPPSRVLVHGAGGPGHPAGSGWAQRGRDPLLQLPGRGGFHGGKRLCRRGRGRARPSCCLGEERWARAGRKP